jgi:hypothetical protein
VLREKAEAHRIIQAMQRTRVWRLGSAYWRVRDGLLRRRPSTVPKGGDRASGL